jgi:hypothetical protein
MPPLHCIAHTSNPNLHIGQSPRAANMSTTGVLETRAHGKGPSLCTVAQQATNNMPHELRQ